MNKSNKVAVGISYTPLKADAPTISVKGFLHDAEEIVKIANRFNVPVVSKSHITEALSTLSVDEHIPESLYEAVAVLFKELEV